MKKPLYILSLIAALILVALAPEAKAQGLIVRGGMNLSNFDADPEIDDTDHRLGFNAAILGEVPLTDVIHLQVGPGYEQRGVNWTPGDEEYLLSADYIAVPVMLSLRTPSATPGRASARFFLNLGVVPAFLISSDFEVGDVIFELDDEAEKFDFGLRGEAGIELPFTATGPGGLIGVGYSYSLTDATRSDDTEWHNYAFHAFIGLKIGGL